MRMPALERFHGRYRIAASGCWVWAGGLTSAGYGKFNADGRQWLAHRFAFTSVHGDLPSVIPLDHLCRVRACVNPAHLEPVTQRVNIVERGTGPTAINARKTECIRGHALDGANTYRSGSRRRCRKCRAVHKATYEAKKRREAA